MSIELIPITRKEKILAGEQLEPITREEKFLAMAATIPVEIPSFTAVDEGAQLTIVVTEDGPAMAWVKPRVAEALEPEVQEEPSP